MIQRLSLLLSLLLPLLSLAPAAHGLSAEPSAPMFREPRPWSEVEDILAAAEQAKLAGYDNPGGRVVLAPDGRMVTLYRSDGAPMSAAMLGRWAREGAWIKFNGEAMAVDLGSLDDEARAEYEAWMEMARQAQLEEEAEARERSEGIEADAEAESSQAEMEAMFNPRLLVVPYRGGEVLLREDSLPGIAADWDGDGPLVLRPEAWRVPGLVFEKASDAYAHEFSIADPLHANLPHELARLLRRDAIEARVTQRLVPADGLQWSHHRAKVRLELDRGERDGLYAGMDVYGLPPDEHLFAELVEVGKDRAIAEYSVQRFAPADPVDLIAPGARVSTRRDRTLGCGVDSSVAVRAKVTRVAPGPLEFDADGYAWVRLEIDQGSRHGLMLEDSFDAEGEGITGEGRVRALRPEAATVLWRVQRWDPEAQAEVPAPGAALVTPAWRRAEWDVFGNRDAVE